MPVKRNFVDLSHGQLHYRHVGNPNLPAVVCLHMMPKSGRGFVELLAALEDRFYALAPDFPGYGESDFFVEGQPTVEDYAGSIAEFITSQGLTQAHLLGYHTGAKVAVELAHSKPDLVQSVSCISAPVFSHEELSRLRTFFKPIPLDQVGTRYQTMWQRVQEFAGPGMGLEMCAESMAENLRGGERYEEGHIAAFNYADVFLERLIGNPQPLKVFNIGDDLYQQTRRAKAHLAAADYCEIQSWGHGFLELHAKEFADLLSEFIESVQHVANS